MLTGLLSNAKDPEDPENVPVEENFQDFIAADTRSPSSEKDILTPSSQSRYSEIISEIMYVQYIIYY